MRLRDVSVVHSTLLNVRRPVVDAHPQVVFRVVVAAILAIVLGPHSPVIVVPSESVAIVRLARMACGIDNMLLLT